ncbi:plantazolicin family TOMM peptide [Brevibacterium aurantiacum]
MSTLISKLPPAVSTDSSKVVSEVQAFEPTAARCSCTTLPCCCCSGG